MIEISGVQASVRWGYQSAATLGAWTATRRASGQWSFTASVLVLDTYRVTQRPLRVEAPHANGAFRWPVVELQVAGESLTATLGPHEG